jgi:hypothetical protein
MLVAARKPAKPSALVQRRHKLSNKLWEQLQLAQAQAAGESPWWSLKLISS